MYYAYLFFGKIGSLQVTYTKNTHITSIFTFLSIGLNISLNIPFIARWGAFGAAWATLLAGIIHGTISIYVAQRYYKIMWEYKKIVIIYMLMFLGSISVIYLRACGLNYSIRIFIKLIYVLMLEIISFQS